MVAGTPALRTESLVTIAQSTLTARSLPPHRLLINDARSYGDPLFSTRTQIPEMVLLEFTVCFTLSNSEACRRQFRHFVCRRERLEPRCDDPKGIKSQ